MGDLLHYAKEPFEFEHDRTYEINQHASIGKPGGFWWSVGESWKEWCETEDFGLGEHPYRVILRPDAKVLRLKTVEELLAFTKNYEVPGPGSYFKTIGWDRVQADGFQGVQIAPYQWELRLEQRTNWYYTWDCASGVAWDPNAIERIELLTRVA